MRRGWRGVKGLWQSLSHQAPLVGFDFRGSGPWGIGGRPKCSTVPSRALRAPERVLAKLRRCRLLT
jgi:hypothetical protein